MCVYGSLFLQMWPGVRGGIVCECVFIHCVSDDSNPDRPAAVDRCDKVSYGLFSSFNTPFVSVIRHFLLSFPPGPLLLLNFFLSSFSSSLSLYPGGLEDLALLI